MIVGKIYITGEIGVETTLLDVIRQVKSQKNATEYLVVIDSVGGYVDEGRAIYDYLKNLSVPVHTYAKQAYSIASVIFMAGERRIVDEGADKPILVHLPWTRVEGNTVDLQGTLESLQVVESQLVKFYSDSLGIDKSTIQSLLQKETFLNATQALELGFATELKATVSAMAKLENNVKEESNWMNKLTQKIDAIYNKVFGIKAELVLQDATGIEVIFPDLNDGETPAAGAKATVDGKPAEGDYLMPDGSTMTFSKGELTAVTPAEPAPAENAADNPTADPAPTDNPDAKIAELEAKIAELQAKIDELLGTQQLDKLMEVLDASASKQLELENKYLALAKSVGSDFQIQNKVENTPNVKATAEGQSRAWQILNS